jgi:3-isopropylmalate/(R)-2-methylmalate dehydratase small subunit
LEEQQIITPSQQLIPFNIDGALKHRLLNGLDDIGVILQSAERIRRYEERRRQEAPWLF